MSRREDPALLRDMLGAARSAIAAIKGRGPDALAADHVWTLGLVKCLEIVGEAAGRFSEAFRGRHPDVAWAQIVGMRNRLVHAYFEIDCEQVWRALTEDLPPLIERLEETLADESAAGS